MRKVFVCILGAAAVLSAGAAEWMCKDGTGSRIVKDFGPDKQDLEIRHPDKVSWAREDDRGFFLNYAGGEVSRLADSRMFFPDGMIIQVRFAANLNDAPREWLPLITAVDFDKGYSVWVNKNGQLLVCFPGAGNWYKKFNAGIRHLRDYELKVIRGQERVQVILNGDVIADYASKGKLRNPAEKFRLYLGGTGRWPFYGNIYSCSITPFKEGAFVKGKKEVRARAASFPGSEIKQLNHIKDPEGTVFIKDFSRFVPKPVVVSQNVPGPVGWSWRKSSFFLQSEGALFAPVNPEEQIISFRPEVKGRYDVYLGLRVTGTPTDLIVAVPDENCRYRVRIGSASPQFHPNTEVAVARNVKMDGGKIEFYPGSVMFLGYIKLIPSDNPRKEDYPKWECVSVTREKRTYSEISDEQISEKIRSGFFRERLFVGPDKTDHVSDASRQHGYIAFPQDWMDLCFEHVAPKTDPGAFTLKAKAAQGEFEPVTLGVHGLEDCGEVTLSGGDALKKSGVKVDIAAVLSFAKRTTNYTGSSEFIAGPQCLERTNTAEVKKGRTKQFWITVKVPENMKAGLYRDHFTLTSRKGKQDIPFELEVRPFKLDPVSWNRIGLFSAIYWVPEESVIREMADHGLNTVVSSLGSFIPLNRDTSGKLQIDLTDPKIAKIMNVFRETGIKTLILHTDELNLATWKQKNGDAEYCRIIRRLQEYTEANQGPELYFYTRDEVLSQPDKLQSSVWEVKQLKKCRAKVFNTHIWFKTSRFYQKEVDQLAPHIDVFCVRFNTRNLWYVDSWQTMQDECRERGRELWSYNADNAILFSQPAMKRFSHGWFFRSLGEKTRGQATYAYQRFDGSPYNDLDGKIPDWCYVYPATRFHKGGFAIDYEAIREGVDDLRYIETLENSIARAKKQGIDTASAGKLLSNLKNSFDFGPEFRKKSIFLTPSFEKTWNENGKRYCSGPYNLPNGWSFAAYHDAREKIAAEIVRLNRQSR